MSLFICGDPGSRLGTVAAWLTDELAYGCFEPGMEFGSNFEKQHTDFGNILVEQNKFKKIRIRPDLKKLHTHLYLFLKKNVQTQILDFTKNEFDLETFAKCTVSAKDWLEHDAQIDYSQYNYILDFHDTFDITAMIDLYRSVNKRHPSNALITNLLETNRLNDVALDKNHACNITAMVMQREMELGIKEEHRFWSVVDIYNNVQQNELYDTIYSHINKENYGMLL